MFLFDLVVRREHGLPGQDLDSAKPTGALADTRALNANIELPSEFKYRLLGKVLNFYLRRGVLTLGVCCDRRYKAKSWHPIS